MTVRSDGEVAMSPIVREVCRLRVAEGAQRTAVDTRPVGGDSAINGIAERAARAVQEHMRTARSALKDQWSVRMVARHPVWPWLIEHVTVLLNCCEIGARRAATNAAKERRAR